ncbi:MAG TPA: hypothetical protein VIQ29_04260 [Ancylobacter sp.]
MSTVMTAMFLVVPIFVTLATLRRIGGMRAVPVPVQTSRRRRL